MSDFVIPLVILLGFGLVYVMFYNGLVKARQKVLEAWSGIDVQLRRRHDLIPNLVATVKGYMTHERETLERLTAARTGAEHVPSGDVAGASSAESLVTTALRGVLAVAENYPDLKADANFRHLQDELSETEDNIAAARRIYNGNVADLNVKIESIPSNLVAAMHGFRKADFFELQENERAASERAPQVQF